VFADHQSAVMVMVPSPVFAEAALLVFAPAL